MFETLKLTLCSSDTNIPTPIWCDLILNSVLGKYSSIDAHQMTTQTFARPHIAVYRKCVRLSEGEAYNSLRTFREAHTRRFRIECDPILQYLLREEKMALLTRNCGVRKSQDIERRVATMNTCVGHGTGIEAQNAILIYKLESRKRSGRVVKRDCSRLISKNACAGTKQ